MRGLALSLSEQVEYAMRVAPDPGGCSSACMAAVWQGPEFFVLG
jgi:hypothetical protein